MERCASVFYLWPPGSVPHSLGCTCVSIGAHRPAVRIFQPAPQLATGASVVIAPGGGFVNLPPHEGDAIADWLAAHGLTVFLLRYRLVSSGYPIPTQLRDMQRAIRFVRQHSAEWGLDPSRVAALGVSGGGYLASGAAVFHASPDPLALDDAIDAHSARPNACVLVYALTDPSAYPPFGAADRCADCCNFGPICLNGMPCRLR
jgi:acetyl esterase/lipase